MIAPALKVVPATPLLVVRRRARQSELSKVVPELCGVVWNYLRAANITPRGRNVAVYLNGKMDLEVGVEVGAGAIGSGDIVLSATPSGTVVTAAHIGPYSSLGMTHEAIHKWIVDNKRHKAGPSWEIYGHWTDDVTQLRTDVFYLLSE